MGAQHVSQLHPVAWGAECLQPGPLRAVAHSIATPPSGQVELLQLTPSAVGYGIAPLPPPYSRGRRAMLPVTVGTG